MATESGPERKEDIVVRRAGEMMRVVNEVAPAARATRLAAAPVVGAVLLGM